jgi:methylated-DNA-protein-cysteine methyltransferase-like protein
MTETTRAICQAIRSIPRGQVSSYRDIAREAGLPNGARQVVRVLHSLSDKENLPWWRVIRADGHIGLPPGEGRDLQIALLREEGVQVSSAGRVESSR